VNCASDCGTCGTNAACSDDGSGAFGCTCDAGYTATGACSAGATPVQGLNNGQFTIADLGVTLTSVNHRSAAYDSSGGGLDSPVRAFMDWMDDPPAADGWLLIGSGSETVLDSFIMEPISTLEGARRVQGMFSTTYNQAGAMVTQDALNLRTDQMSPLGGGNSGSAEYYFYAPNTRNWLTDPDATARPSYEYEYVSATNMSAFTGTPGTCSVSTANDCLHPSSMGYISSAAINDVVNSEIIGSVAVGSLQLRLTDNAHF
jgi:hypothetical protein